MDTTMTMTMTVAGDTAAVRPILVSRTVVRPKFLGSTPAVLGFDATGLSMFAIDAHVGTAHRGSDFGYTPVVMGSAQRIAVGGTGVPPRGDPA